MNRITIQATMDPSGNVTARPMVTRYAQSFAAHVESMGGPAETTVFFNDGFESTEFVENNVPKRLRNYLKDGYTIAFLADPWIVGHWYGYDAHEVTL